MSKLDELDRAERSMTPGPWECVAEGSKRAETAQAVIRPLDGDIGTDLMDTLNRGYKVSGITEVVDEDSRLFYDEAGEKDLAGITLLRNNARALIDIARAAKNYLEGSKRADTEALESALARLEAE